MSDDIVKIRADYQKNGGINYQDIRAKDWADAHFQLGQLFKSEINQIAADRFSEPGFDLKFQADLANLCLGFLQTKLDDVQVGGLIKLYLICLEAWANGCCLQAASYGLSKLELALILQNDVVGCITTLIRNSADNVHLVHSEEDVSGTINKPTVIHFSIQKDGEVAQKITSFIYPALLPGPAFSFSEKMVMANDFLYTNHCQDYFKNKQPFCLINILTWILFITQDYALAETYASKLMPFVDGNAINLVNLEAKTVGSQLIIEAKSIEIAGDQLKVKELPIEPESYQVQVNIFNQPASLICQNNEDVNADKKLLLSERVEIIKRFLKNNLNLPFPKIASFQALQEGGSFAPANRDVKATFLADIFPAKTEFKIVAGPLLSTDFQ